MIADACNIACDEIYNLQTDQWVKNGIKQPSLFITTELDIQEVTTMALAFLSGVNEEHIIKNKYMGFGEKERVFKAAEILSRSPLFIEEMPNFTMKDIENCIKRNIRVHGVQYIFYDYLHSSLGILSEVAQATRGTKLREDNILFMLSVKLKDIANQFGVFVMTSTQLNGGWKSDDTPDQNLLRGSKSISDRADWASILLDVTREDVEAIDPIVKTLNCEIPNVKLSIYKNRRSNFNKCFLWMKADKGICRFDGLFATDYDYNIIPIEDVRIEVTER
jgi:replicative DNA helicase